MRICAMQIDIAVGDKAANYATVRRLTEKVMRSAMPPDIIVLPELWSTGYALTQAKELASPHGDEEAAFLGELACTYSVAFAGGSVMAREGERVANRAQCITKEGKCIGTYDKIHLFRLMDEDVYLHQGNARLLFDMEGMRCGSVICYDIRFCELVRRLALDGAHVLFVSAEWPLSRKYHWLTLLCARAIENQMYIVACNRCGTTGNETFGGNSLIIAPDGTILAQAGTEEDIICAEVDPELVNQTRSKIPVFEDRVPDVY